MIALISTLAVVIVSLSTYLLWRCNVKKQDVKRIRNDGERPYSTKAVTCLTNVEAFILRAEDLGEVTRRFSRFLKIPRVQRAAMVTKRGLWSLRAAIVSLLFS